MTIEASIVFHYLYGYQTMRLASQDEIKAFHISDTESPETCKEANGDRELKITKTEQEETSVKRKIKPPDGVALCISSIPGARFGVCSLKDIPGGTWFGPFEGKLVRRSEAIGGAMSESMWEIFHDGEVSHFLDGQTQNTWMSFVKCARHKKEQNMVVFQYHGCIYYRTTREITPGSELLVWYDAKYTQFLGLPMGWNDNKGSSGKRKGAGSLHCESVRKKRSIEDGGQVPVLARKLLECQPIPLQKKMKMQDFEPYAGTRGYYIKDTKMPDNGIETSAGSGLLYPHAFYSHMTGAVPQFTSRSHHVHSVPEEHGLHTAQPFQSVSFDKWREYRDNHNWQEPGWYVEGYEKNKSYFDFQQEHNRKDVTKCKNIALRQPIARPPQIHPIHKHHQYNPNKDEDTSIHRDVKEGCIPRV